MSPSCVAADLRMSDVDPASSSVNNLSSLKEKLSRDTKYITYYMHITFTCNFLDHLKMCCSTPYRTDDMNIPLASTSPPDTAYVDRLRK